MRQDPKRPGRWELCAYVGRDPVTGRQVRKWATAVGSAKDARRALAALVAKAEGERGLQRGPAVPTVRAFARRWLEHIGGTRTPTTVRSYQRIVDHRVVPAIGGVRLDAVRPADLDDLYARWAAEGLAPATVRRHHAAISAMFSQAVRWGYLDRSPASADLVTTPKVGRQAVPEPPSPGQLAVWLRQAQQQDPVLAGAAALAALTGLRRGELVALRWSDIDLDGGVLTVARSVSAVDGKTIEGETKTHRVRRVALDEVAAEGVRLMQAHQRAFAADVDVPLVPDPRLLTYDPRGEEPAHPDSFTHGWRRVCGGACRFHDLRHFSGTQMVAAGVDLRTVMARLGHAQLATTTRYLHALEDRDRAAAAVLGATLGAAPTVPALT